MIWRFGGWTRRNVRLSAACASIILETNATQTSSREQTQQPPFEHSYKKLTHIHNTHKHITHGGDEKIKLTKRKKGSLCTRLLHKKLCGFGRRLWNPPRPRPKCFRVCRAGVNLGNVSHVRRACDMHYRV